MAGEGRARAGSVCSLQQPERPSRAWGVKTPRAPTVSKCTTGVGGAHESCEHGSRELRRAVKMQGHTQGGQCDLKNVNGGRLVCADGVRLGPASQGTADISDGVGGQSHPRRADGWSRAGCPSASLACGCLGPAVAPSGRQRARGLPPGKRSLWLQALAHPPGAGRGHWPGGPHPAGMGAGSVIKGTAGSLLEGDPSSRWWVGRESTLDFCGNGHLVSASLRTSAATVENIGSSLLVWVLWHHSVAFL